MLKEGETGGGFWRYDVRDHDELTLNRRPVMILSRESTGQARGGCTAFGQLVSEQQHQKLGTTKQ